MLRWKIVNELRSSPSCSVPTAGMAIANLSKNAAYQAAQRGDLGVPTFWVGGKLRVPSLAVLQKLGLVEAAEGAGQQAIEAPPDPGPAAREPQAQRRKTFAKPRPKSPPGPERRTPSKKIRRLDRGYAAGQDGEI